VGVIVGGRAGADAGADSSPVARDWIAEGKLHAIAIKNKPASAIAQPCTNELGNCLDDMGNSPGRGR